MATLTKKGQEALSKFDQGQQDRRKRYFLTGVALAIAAGIVVGIFDRAEGVATMIIIIFITAFLLLISWDDWTKRSDIRREYAHSPFGQLGNLLGSANADRLEKLSESEREDELAAIRKDSGEYLQRKNLDSFMEKVSDFYKNHEAGRRFPSPATYLEPKN